MGIPLLKRSFQYFRQEPKHASSYALARVSQGLAFRFRSFASAQANSASRAM